MAPSNGMQVQFEVTTGDPVESTKLYVIESFCFLVLGSQFVFIFGSGSRFRVRGSAFGVPTE